MTNSKFVRFDLFKISNNHHKKNNPRHNK